MLLAIRVALATPAALVVTGVLATVTPGAVEAAGAVKVTVCPLTGLPSESWTVAVMAAKVLLTGWLCGVPPAMMVAGGPAVTVTLVLAEAKFGADALILMVPRARPVTVGWVAGVVAPAAINTLAVTVALVVSLEVRVTVVPPVGAAFCRLIFNVTGA